MIGAGESGKSPDCRVRQGRCADWDFVANLSRQVFSEYGDYERILPACLEDRQFRALISEENGRSTGFCILSIGEGVGEVVAIAVDPLNQGRGVGRRLMRAVMEEAGSMGMRLLALKTARRNLAAQGLFRKMGFEETGRVAGYYAGGQTAIAMLKRL